MPFKLPLRIEGGIERLLHGRMVNFTITGWCNARCVFCHFPTVKDRPVVSLDDAKRAIDALAKLDVTVLNLTGGEPFLNHSICDIAAYATAAGMTVYTGTNGTMMTPAIADRLAQARLQGVWISYEGPDAETFDRNRGVKGLTEKIRKGLRYLKSAGVETFCICVINRTISDYRAFIDHVVDLGYSTVKFDYPQRRMGSSYLAFSDWDMLDLSADEMHSAIEQILAIKRERYRGIYVMNGTEGLLGAQRFWRGEPAKYPCSAGDRVLYLDVNLRLHRCTVLPEQFGKVWDVRPEQLTRIECNQCYYQGVRDYDNVYFLFSALLAGATDVRAGHLLTALGRVADSRMIGGARSVVEFAFRR